MNASIRWFVTEGAPVVVLPRAAYEAWEGADCAALFQPGYSQRTTDFDRACSVPGRAKVLRVGTSSGLVVNARNSAGWLPLSRLDLAGRATRDGVHDDSAERVWNRFRACQPAGWRFIAHEVLIDTDGLLLMHAVNQVAETEIQEYAAPGYAGLGDGIPYPLTPGHYRVEAHKVRTCKCGSEVRFIRLRHRPPQRMTGFAGPHALRRTPPSMWSTMMRLPSKRCLRRESARGQR